jgi:murein DD-endopeptidase MepM/ murein hydrolase activator NlpD
LTRREIREREAAAAVAAAGLEPWQAASDRPASEQPASPHRSPHRPAARPASEQPSPHQSPQRPAERPAFDAIFGRPDAPSHPTLEASSLRRGAVADQTPFTPSPEAEHTDRPVGRSSASSVPRARESASAFDTLFAGLDDEGDEPTGQPAGRARRDERGDRSSLADRKAKKAAKAEKPAKPAKAPKAPKGKAAKSGAAGPRRSGVTVPVPTAAVGDDLAFLLGSTAAASGAATSGSARAAEGAAGFATAIAAAAGAQSASAPAAPSVPAVPPVPTLLTFDAPVRRDPAFDLFGSLITDATPDLPGSDAAFGSATSPSSPVLPSVLPSASSTPPASSRRRDAARPPEPRDEAPTSSAPLDDWRAFGAPHDDAPTLDAPRGDSRASHTPRGAARSRTAQPRRQASGRPAARPVASARSSRRRAAGRLVSMIAMSFVALLAVATTIPSLSLLTAADVQALALSSTGGPGLEGQRVDLNGDIVAQSIQREGYETQTVEEYARAAGIRPEASFINNPAGTIQWPFAVGVHIGDRFGYRDCYGCSSNHGGQDFNPGLGAEIQAIADGIVSNSTDSGGSLGVVMMIDHMIDGELVTSVYAHMEYDSRRFEEGDTVAVGDIIGTTGDTGMSTGPHLHFEIRIGGMNGTKVDPLEWLYANTN